MKINSNPYCAAERGLIDEVIMPVTPAINSFRL